jgi:hypothetical protein
VHFSDFIEINKYGSNFMKMRAIVLAWYNAHAERLSEYGFQRSDDVRRRSLSGLLLSDAQVKALSDQACKDMDEKPRLRRLTVPTHSV